MAPCTVEPRRCFVSWIAAARTQFYLSLCFVFAGGSERNKGGQETLTTGICLTDGPLFLSATLDSEQGEGNDRNGRVWENQIPGGG